MIFVGVCLVVLGFCLCVGLSAIATSIAGLAGAVTALVMELEGRRRQDRRASQAERFGGPRA